MKIEYNEIEKSIEIKDNLKTHYFLMRVIMVLNLISAIVNLVNANETGFGFFKILWVFIGVIALIALYIFVVKKSTLEKIPIKKIKKLKEKSVFGKKHFALELNNGQKRDLNELKNESKINELRKLFNNLGIRS